MSEVIVCSKCDWKMLLGLTFGSLEWIPPCPRCDSIVEGFRIINKEAVKL